MRDIVLPCRSPVKTISLRSLGVSELFLDLLLMKAFVSRYKILPPSEPRRRFGSFTGIKGTLESVSRRAKNLKDLVASTLACLTYRQCCTSGSYPGVLGAQKAEFTHPRLSEARRVHSTLRDWAGDITPLRIVS
jgi:hypothetical protein